MFGVVQCGVVWYGRQCFTSEESLTACEARRIVHAAYPVHGLHTRSKAAERYAAVQHPYILMPGVSKLGVLCTGCQPVKSLAFQL